MKNDDFFGNLILVVVSLFVIAFIMHFGTLLMLVGLGNYKTFSAQENLMQKCLIQEDIDCYERLKATEH